MVTPFEIQLLNLAYFGRPSDPAAISGWQASGLTASQIVLIFVGTGEYKVNTLADPAVETPSGTVNLQGLITELYVRLGGRPPAQVEINAWTNAVTSGAVNLDYLPLTLANAILNLPDGTDLENNLRKKLQAADVFTGKLAASPTQAVLYTSWLPIQIGIDYLKGVNAGTTNAQIDTRANTAIASLPPLNADFTLTNSASSVNEGNAVSIKLQAFPLNEPPAGKVYAYRIIGSGGFDANDVEGGSLTGTATVDGNGVAFIEVRVKSDAVLDPGESFKIEVNGFTTYQSAPITVIDVPPVPGLQVNPSSTAVNEGETLTFFISSQNLAPGTLLTYTLSGAGLTNSDFNGAPLTGTVTLGATGLAQVTFNISADLTTEGPETVNFTVQGPGGVSATTTSVINDTSTTPVLPTSAVLTINQDILTAAAVDTFTFIANTGSSTPPVPTLGQGDELDGRPATNSILRLNAFGEFSINNFSTLGVDTFRLFVNDSDQEDDSSINMSGGGRNPQTGAIDPNLAFKTIRIDQSNLGSLLFRDIQAITIEGSPLFIDVVDATTCFKFNFDVNALLAATDQLNLRISEVPIDLSTGKASGFDFTQGPFSSDADIEKLDLTSTGPSANFLNQLSVGSDLETLIISGDQDFTLTTDLGKGEYGDDSACGPNDNDQVRRIDASALAADLSLIYTSAFNGVVDVEGAQGTNKLIFGSSIWPATRFDVFINNNPALGPGNDTVVTGPGSDTVVSGIGNDSIDVGDGNNSVDAGEGNDTVIAGNGSDSVQGGTGNDLLTVGDGNNTVDANAGNDTVTAGEGNDSVLGGIGNDSICVDGGNNIVDAGSGNDTVGADSGNDSVLGGEGFDLIAVGSGNNTVDGGTENDTILAGNGNDSLVGGGGLDVIYAGGGNNVVRSGTEDDLIQIGGGRDIVLAGLGNDTVVMRAEALTNLDQISGDESLIWEFAPGGPAPAGYGTEDYIWFTEGGTIGTSETLGVQNIEGFKLWNLPSFDISPDVIVCGDEYGGTDPTMGMAADYTIVLSQEVVRKSNDIQPINPAGFQNQRVFTIDAEDANRVDPLGNKVTFVDVTVDLTNLEQGDGFGNRTGFVYKGQDDLRQGNNIELIILDQAMVSETLVIDFNETTFQDSYIPDECGPVGLQTNFLQFVGQDTFVADADDLINIDDSDRIILSAETGRFDVTFNIELTTAWLEKQMEDTGWVTPFMEDYAITPDASLFPGATLNLYLQPDLPPLLDTGIPGGRLFVYTSGMLQVNYFDLDTGVAINFADLPSWVVQLDGLFFTPNADDIQGTDCDETIYAFQVSDLNAADSVNGGGGFDTVEFDFGVFNTQAKTSTSTSITYEGVCPEIFTSYNFNINGLTLSEQLNFVDFNNVEEFIFDPKNQDGVRFTGFNFEGDQKEEIDLEDLDVLRTSPPSSGKPNSGNDLLLLDDYSGDAGEAYGFANLAVFTYDGNDTIFLESGSYWVESGNGNDVVLAPSDHQGEDSVQDVFQTSYEKGDTVNAGTGNDFVFLGSGDDVVLAGDGNDTVTTGFGNDFVDGGNDNDVISAGEGNNTVVDLDGNNVITAEAGNDSILTGAGNDSIHAGDGANSVAAGEGDNIVCSGTGNDTVTTGSGNDTISTDGGNDSITAGDGNNSILAGAGNDTVSSGSGNDTIDAGSGNDSIVSGAGNDSILFPGNGDLGTDDTVLAGAGTDTVQFSITTSTDLAPRTVTGATGSVPGGVADTNPLFSQIEQLVVNFNADDVTLRLADSVVGQISDDGLNGGGTIKVVANAQNLTNDAIISAGDTETREGGAGYFKANQVFDVTLNRFATEADGATTKVAPGPDFEDQNTWISATAPDAGDLGSRFMRQELINALFFDDDGIGSNIGAGAIGGSANDIFTIGEKSAAPVGNNSYGFVSLQGNGGGDTFNLSGSGPLQNPDQNDRYVEFIRYVTAQDGSDPGAPTTYDVVNNFDKGQIFLSTNGENPETSATGRRLFTDVVTLTNGESTPINNDRPSSPIDGLGITDITGDKLIIEGSLYDGITGSNGNFLLDRFTVNKGFDLDEHEALFLTNPAGVTDDLITNFDYVASRANVLAGGINADNDDGGLIIIQGISKSAVYFFQNEEGLSGAAAKVESSELRLLSVVDVPTLYADDFLFNPQAQINV